MSSKLSDIFLTKRDLEDFANLVAAAVIKQITPVKDRISTNQAYQEFGRRWIDSRTKAELLHPHRSGKSANSPRHYSRAEIVALQEAEKLAFIQQ